MTEPDIAHVVKEISGARVPPTKVILAQIRDVAVLSKILSFEIWNSISRRRLELLMLVFTWRRIFFITELETLSILKI